MLLGLTLLHTYHLFAFFITYWYGRLEIETNILNYLMFQSYAGIFWVQLIFTFFIPFPILVSNHARRLGWGAPLAAVFIIIGLMLFHNPHLCGGVCIVPGRGFVQLPHA